MPLLASLGQSQAQVLVAPTVVEPDDGVDEQVTEAEEVEEITECVICFVNPIGAKMVPCGHTHFCLDCAGLIFAGAVDPNPRCPVCRTQVTGIAEVAADEAADQQEERREALRDAHPYSLILAAHRRGSAPQVLVSTPARAASYVWGTWSGTSGDGICYDTLADGYDDSIADAGDSDLAGSTEGSCESAAPASERQGQMPQMPTRMERG